MFTSSGFIIVHQSIIRDLSTPLPISHPLTLPPSPPTSRRFNNMEDYFSRGHLPDFPSALSVRVTVTDERTGR